MSQQGKIGYLAGILSGIENEQIDSVDHLSEGTEFVGIRVTFSDGEVLELYLKEQQKEDDEAEMARRRWEGARKLGLPEHMPPGYSTMKGDPIAQTESLTLDELRQRIQEATEEEKKNRQR